jgi:hypothetical protein
MEEGFINLISGEKGTMIKNEIGIIESITIIQPAIRKINYLGSNSLEFQGTYGTLQDICGKSKNGKCICITLCPNRGTVIESTPIATSFSDKDKKTKVKYHRIQGEIIGYISIDNNVVHSIVKTTKIIWILNGKEVTTLSIAHNPYVKFDIEILKWKTKNIQRGTPISFQILDIDSITYKGKWTPLKEAESINVTGIVLDYQDIARGEFLILIKFDETSACEIIRKIRPTIGEVITFTFNELTEPSVYIGEEK